MKIAHAPDCNIHDGRSCDCDGDPMARLWRRAKAAVRPIIEREGRNEVVGPDVLNFTLD